VAAARRSGEAAPHSAARLFAADVASSSRPGWSVIKGGPSAWRPCRPTSPTSSATASRDGEKGCMFGATKDRTGAVAFARRGLNDRHYFRFVVTPEDAAEMTDLKAFTRDLVISSARWRAIRHQAGVASPMGTLTPAFASRGPRRRR
jgi:hypothetical protein